MSTFSRRELKAYEDEVVTMYNLDETDLEMYQTEEENIADYEKYDVAKEVNMNKPLAIYLEQIDAEQLYLDKDAEIECIRQFRVNGDTSARDKVIKNNLKFVVFMCKNKFRTWKDPLELISVGNEALIRSVEAFDYTKNTDFRTYAGTSIKRAVNTYISSVCGVELPDETMRLKFHVNKTINELQMTSSNGEHITSEEIAAVLNSKGVKINRKMISADDVETVRKFDKLRSINEVVSQDTSSMELGDTFVDEDTDLDFIRVENRAVLMKLFASLSEKEKQVIYLKYMKDMTNEMAGAQLGCTRQRIDQIERKAMTKMRKAAGIYKTA